MRTPAETSNGMVAVTKAEAQHCYKAAIEAALKDLKASATYAENAYRNNCRLDSRNSLESANRYLKHAIMFIDKLDLLEEIPDSPAVQKAKDEARQEYKDLKQVSAFHKKAMVKCQLTGTYDQVHEYYVAAFVEDDGTQETKELIGWLRENLKGAGTTPTPTNQTLTWRQQNLLNALMSQYIEQMLADRDENNKKCRVFYRFNVDNFNLPRIIATVQVAYEGDGLHY